MWQLDVMIMDFEESPEVLTTKVYELGGDSAYTEVTVFDDRITEMLAGKGRWRV